MHRLLLSSLSETCQIESMLVFSYTFFNLPSEVVINSLT